MARVLRRISPIAGKGSRLSHVQAGIVQQIVNSCCNRLGAVDDPAKVIALLSREPRLKNVLDEWFLWNDIPKKLMRDNLRMLSKLLNLIRAPYKEKGKVKTIKINHRLTVGDSHSSSHGWVHISQILNDPALQQQLLSKLNVSRMNMNGAYAGTSRVFKARARCARTRTKGKQPSGCSAGNCGHP
jgi:hypothetical protein